MKVVIDTDGVIVDFAKSYVKYAEQLLNRKLNPNYNEYQLNLLLQLNDADANYVWDNFNKTKQWKKILPFKDTENAIKNLNQYNLDIYVVTAIDKEHQKDREYNLNLLGLYPKEVICVGFNQSKKDIIKEINPKVFIDDRFSHLKDAEQVEHLILINSLSENTMDNSINYKAYNSLNEWTINHLPNINNKRLKI